MHTIPGIGTMHHYETRHGRRFGVIVHRSGERTLLLYNGDDPDAPQLTLELDSDEADQLAQLLEETPLADRVAELERRLAALEERLTAQPRQEPDAR